MPRGALRVIWVSKLIPNDPIVVRKDLPASLKSAIRESLDDDEVRATRRRSRTSGAFGRRASSPPTTASTRSIRDLNETAKQLAAQK